MGIELLRNASMWVSELEDFNTVAQATEYVNMERNSYEHLPNVYFEEICRCDLALLELGQKCDNLIVAKIFNKYKDNDLTYNEVLKLINTDKISANELLEHDDIKQLLTIDSQFLVDFFDLPEEDRDVVLTWLDCHGYNTFGNDPSDILETYRGTYSIAEYVQEYLDESGVEIPDFISIDYQQSFNDLTHDCTIVKLGSKYMIYND